MRRLIVRLALSDEGQELVEYALLAAFIGLAGVAAFSIVANSMNAGYSNWNAGVENLWEPRNP